MKILHLAPHLQPGGADGFALDLACELQRLGSTDNTLMAPTQKQAGHVLASTIRHLSCPKPHFWSFFGSLPRLRNAIERVQPDILLAYGIRATWEARFALRKFPKERRPKLVSVLTTPPHLAVSARCLACCDAFTAVSRHLREILEDSYPEVRRKGAWVIPYGVQEAQCNPTYGPPTDWLQRWENLYPNPGKKLTICIPGAVTPRHGQEDLIPILRDLHATGVHPRVLIAGDTKRADAAYLRHLRRRLKQTNLARDIVWIGATPNMREVFCVSDVVLSLNKEPALYDRPILEALALGCPVVGYDHGVVGELLRTFLPEGLIAPGNTEAVADAIYQWSVYKPGIQPSVPYPYRMTDTAENYMALFRSLMGTETGSATSSPEHG